MPAISRIFTTYHSQNCWAYVSGTGWKKIQTGNADGVTNVHIALTAARSSGIVPTVVYDAADTYIQQVYL